MKPDWLSALFLCSYTQDGNHESYSICPPHAEVFHSVNKLAFPFYH